MHPSCQLCHEQPATVHLTNILDGGEKRERHLCEACAEKEGVLPKPVNVMAQLSAFVQSGKSPEQQVAGLTCPQCKLTFVEFRNKGVLGCPADYDAFAKALNPLIERAHQGASHHVGKTPRRHGAGRCTDGDLIRLRRELTRAVDDERFEDAAQIRDTIRSLETP
ncbi:MAG: UvrB/UvrC motif-containing protein [Phycisphaerales bacterium]|nr:UvrB/UvrC motif-containing protein [Phycisphaerales bacterium]